MSVLGMPPPELLDLPVFRPDGLAYRNWPVLIDELLTGEHRTYHDAARDMIAYLYEKSRMRLLGMLGMLLTDERIHRDTGWSYSYIQKGLYALDVLGAKLGCQFIARFRAHGRRIIVILRGLLGSREHAPKTSLAASPQTPLEKTRTTTTRERSSSSLEKPSEEAAEPRDAPGPELVARALRLIPEATPGRVADVVATYGSEWVSRALDIAERRNRKPGNKPVRSWGFVLRVLENWRREGGPPPVDPPPAATPARPEPEPAREGPAGRLTAAEVADLVERCRDPRTMQARLARTALRLALRDDQISPESLATIPDDLLTPESPRAP